MDKVSRLTERILNGIRGLRQRYGTRYLKGLLWDKEYLEGRWECLEDMPGDCLYPSVEAHAKQGDILDLGCGPGTTASELNADVYRSYTGVEISAVAVERARARAEQGGRSQINRFLQGDLFTYVPDRKCDVIIFGDSIYYVPTRRIRKLLMRYAGYLNPDGVIIVRTWIASRRHRAAVDVIENSFKLITKQTFRVPSTKHVVAVLVFRSSR